MNGLSIGAITIGEMPGAVNLAAPGKHTSDT